MEDDVKQAGADRYAVSQAYRWKAERDKAMQELRQLKREVEGRLMPEGMEWLVEAWPRFEDGEPVKFGDVVSDGDETGRVYYVTFDTVNPVIIGFTDETPDQDPGTWLEVSVNDGERVKRPALGADGVPIREGDTVYEIETGERYFVTNVFDGMTEPDFPEHTVECRKYEDVVTHMFRPSQLTHRVPVLAADGEPLEVGQTVWDTNGDELVIGALEDGGHTVACRYVDVGDAIPAHGMWSPSDLTHERPVADTWERLEEDAEKDPCDYFGFDGEETCGKCPASGKNCEQTMAQDLVRRCRALAERERGE